MGREDLAGGAVWSRGGGVGTGQRADGGEQLSGRLARGGAGGGGKRRVCARGAVFGGAIDRSDAASGRGGRGRHRAAASGGGAGAARGGDLWTDRSGAQWALRNAFAGAARCVERDQLQAGERGGRGNVADRGGRCGGG